MILILIFILGANLASCATCCAFRFCKNISAFVPRSFCDNCYHPLTWWQLLPILGWVIQKGKCHFCDRRIPILSTALESLYGLMFIWLFSHSTNLFSFTLVAGSLIWLLVLSLEDQYGMEVSSFCLYFGALLFTLWGSPQVWRTIKTSWLALLLFFGVCLIFEYHGQLGSADTICLLVIMLVYGFHFGCLLLLLASTIFLVTHLHGAPKTRHAFLPSLSSSFVILAIFQIY